MFSSNTSQQSEGYQISRSLRFNSADSTKLTRTFSTNGTSQKTCTISFWVKLSSTTTNEYRIVDSYDGSSGASSSVKITSNQIILAFGGSGNPAITTTAVYRDYSSWYHIVAVFDSTQATSTDRMKLYVNGVQVTSFAAATYPTQNANYNFMYAGSNNVIGGAWDGTAGQYLNGYMTEVNFIDGQALTPSSFGQTNANTGVWEPKPYAGSYGTNGFYLNFSDNSNTTATTLGKDYSGNGNNWTPNNFSVSAGAGNDSLVDVPTPWGTDTGVGGTVRGNYCTLNPTDSYSGLNSNGNLTVAGVNAYGNFLSSRATMGMSSGKWYWEITVSGATNLTAVGVDDGKYNVTTNPSIGDFVGRWANSWGLYTFNGGIYNGASTPTSTLFAGGLAAGTVIGIAVDMDNGKIYWAKNGVWGNSGNPATQTNPSYTNLTGTLLPAISVYDAASIADINFGQRPFAYTAPSGFKALCTQNLPTPTIGATAATQAGKYFNAVTWTGTGSTQNITGVGFQPDFTWLKSRSNVQGNVFTDVVRGTGKMLVSETSSAEVTNSAYGYLSAFGSDGFTLTPGTTGANLTNYNGWTYVGWNWKANGAGVTNTAGSITSTVSANTTSGFSIVTYTGSGAAATIGHGLGAAPKMIIVKSRDQGTTGYTGNWYVYHASNTAAPETDYLLLNSTAATADDTFWNDTAPTSTVFSVGALSGTNDSGDKFVAYCFAEVPGFSKFGSYTGNGSADGPFVYCGFRPAYVLIKSSNLTWNWFVFDEARSTYNAANSVLLPNSTSSEITGSNYVIDMLSNGFKIRTTDAQFNGSSSDTYIFAAFAEAPQKFALAR